MERETDSTRFEGAEGEAREGPDGAPEAVGHEPQQQEPPHDEQPPTGAPPPPVAPQPPPAESPPAAAPPPQWAYGPPPPPAQPPRRRMSGCLIALLIGIALAVVGGTIAMVAVMLATSSGRGPAIRGVGDRVGIINIAGVIRTSGEGSSIFGPGTPGSREIMQHIRDAAKDRTIKAVVLRINSPGGSAAASQEVYEEVLKLRDEANKPVIVSMADVAASGGYYIASAATTIVANRATMTGSIGVITGVINWTDLAERYGVKEETFTSGPYKDTLNPFRPVRDDERELVQEMIDEVYEQFVSDVARARNKVLTEKAIRKLADGRVYSGSQAKKVKLVDELGNFHDAVRLAAEAAGIEGEPRLKEYGRTYGLSGWLSELARLRPPWPANASFIPTVPSGPGLWMLMDPALIVDAR